MIQMRSATKQTYLYPFLYMPQQRFLCGLFVFLYSVIIPSTIKDHQNREGLMVFIRKDAGYASLRLRGVRPSQDNNELRDFRCLPW
jgi:hypothetical protein